MPDTSFQHRQNILCPNHLAKTIGEEALGNLNYIAHDHEAAVNVLFCEKSHVCLPFVLQGYNLLLYQCCECLVLKMCLGSPKL